MDELRARAAAVGVTAYLAGNGSDGDALAALFPRAWWAVVKRPDEKMGRETGPFHSETAALEGGIKLVGALPPTGVPTRPEAGITIDIEADTITLFGTRYSLDLFRALGATGLAVGEHLEIVDRVDGAVTIRRHVPISA